MTAKVALESETTFDQLVKSLTDKLTDDIQKAWSIFCWVGSQKINEGNTNKTPAEGTPLWYSLNKEPSEYPKLITIMMRKAKLPCVTIRGKAKTSNYEAGDESVDGESQWNAVFVSGSWRLLHPQWAFQSIVGLQKPGWIKFEDDGEKTREEVAGSEGQIVSTRETFYFLADPEDFIHFCRPPDDQKGWQLIKPSLSKDRYIKLPFIRPQYAKSNAKFSFRRGQINTIEAKKGECELAIQVNNSKWRGQLSYSLLVYS
ncbi:hillarin-like [Gigantopelta aegis]|uniref:hillarin-like n=1 Tax=Gigantopelta aegis TaxID=1735272 RepID=UPI001B88A5F2|nr:hillarin-like [Gigantopelta aegis]